MQSYAPPCVHHDLQQLLAAQPSGIAASAGRLYEGAFFGRDSAEVAEDLLPFEPEITRRIIIQLARHQGIRNVPNGPTSNEEEVGRIHHECRELPDDEEGNVSEELKQMWKRWGGVGNRIVYYGSVDATPLFIRLVSGYCARWGNDILDEAFRTIHGDIRTLRSAVFLAVTWLVNRLDESSLGFLEFVRKNQYGIVHQGWKDSMTAYVHPDGHFSNARAPITSIEIQGLAYDALLGAAELFCHELPTAAVAWKKRAAVLQKRVFTLLWMPVEQYFAQGIDRHADGTPRQIQTLSSNAAALMDTRIFDNLPKRQREMYVDSIIARVTGPEFLTDAGIRCRALRHHETISFTDYHGSCVVWPKETYDIAKGCRRQGYHTVADRLEERLLDAINRAGNAVEFFFVNEEGSVAYETYLLEEDLPSVGSPSKQVIATNLPEHTQAWTVSAIVAIKRRRGAKKSDDASLCATSPYDGIRAQEIPVITVQPKMAYYEEIVLSQVAVGVNRPKARKMSRSLHLREQRSQLSAERQQSA